jgi:comEA protein
MIRKISKKLTLTETEVKVMLFLLVILSIGLGAKYLFLSEKITQYQEFDYSQEDSLFALMGKQDTGKSLKGNTVVIVDSEQEVLDFNKKNFSESRNFKISAEKSININKAGINELVQLPGIGEKTALNIIEYRKAHGAINSLQDLLNISGIGSSKLTKIKDYITFDKQSDSIKTKE